MNTVLRLPPRFYDYAPAVSDFHIQAMAVHQIHAQQGCDAHCVNVNVSWPTVPDHCGVVDVEGHHRTVSQSRPAPDHKGQLQLSHQFRRQGQIAAVPCVYHGFYLPILWTSYRKAHYRFKKAVHHTLDHLALHRELPPKVRNVGCPTRTNQASASGRRAR